MKSLKLSNSEMTEMKQFYEEELNKTLRKLQHINEVLNKLDPGSGRVVINYGEGAASVTSTPATTAAPAPAQEAPPADENGADKQQGAKSLAQRIKSQQKTAPKKGRKKRGRKSVWGQFILDYLKQQDRPVTYEELIGTAMNKFSLPKSKEKSVDQAIRNSSFRLRKTNRKIETFSVDNSKEKFLALRDWFDKSNNLKLEYENKLPEDI